MSQSVVFINTIWTFRTNGFIHTACCTRGSSVLYLSRHVALRSVVRTRMTIPPLEEVQGTRSSVQFSPPRRLHAQQKPLTRSTCLQRLLCPRPAPASARLRNLPRSGVPVNRFPRGLTPKPPWTTLSKGLRGKFHKSKRP